MKDQADIFLEKVRKITGCGACEEMAHYIIQCEDIEWLFASKELKISLIENIPEHRSEQCEFILKFDEVFFRFIGYSKFCDYLVSNDVNSYDWYLPEFVYCFLKSEIPSMDYPAMDHITPVMRKEYVKSVFEFFKKFDEYKHRYNIWFDSWRVDKRRKLT